MVDASESRPEASATEASSNGTTSAAEATIHRSGLYLVTSGYDSTVKIWSSDDWQLVKAVTTDSGKVMGVDVDGEGKYIAAGSANRSFQLLGRDEEE